MHVRAQLAPRPLEPSGIRYYARLLSPGVMYWHASGRAKTELMHVITLVVGLSYLCVGRLHEPSLLPAGPETRELE